MYDQHHHQHQHKHQHENLTDAHHAWTWGAVWRGGEGGDLQSFHSISRLFFFLLVLPGVFGSLALCGLDLNRSSVDLCCCWKRRKCSHFNYQNPSKSNKPESAWTTVAGVHVGQPRADHRVAWHLVALASKSLQGRVVTVRELKRKKVFQGGAMLLVVKQD